MSRLSNLAEAKDSRNPARSKGTGTFMETLNKHEWKYHPDRQESFSFHYPYGYTLHTADTIPYLWTNVQMLCSLYTRLERKKHNFFFL